jgi:hypothetical protein
MAILRDEVQRLSAELADLRARFDAPSPRVEPSAEVASSDGPMNRRSLLRVAGTGAAVVAAGAVTGAAGAVVGARPAAAANGSNLVLGTANDATFETLLTDNGAGYKTTHFLQVTDNDTNVSTTKPAAVGGLATNSTLKVGVYGSTTNPDFYGVVGKLEALGGQGIGAGVLGDGTGAGNGVYGTGEIGVLGQGSSVGVAGNADVGLSGAGTAANLVLVPGGMPAPARNAGSPGQFIVDQNDDLWFCIAPNTWRRLSGPGASGGLFVLDDTMRVYDSRPGYLPSGVTKGPFTAGSSRAIDCTLNGAVPAGATAALVNVTVTNTSPAGFVGVFKHGLAWPGNSTVNWSTPNTSTANMAVVALSDAAVFDTLASQPTDLIVDVIGYYG